MTALRTLDDIDVAGRRVLLRVDLNVPVANGRVSDATRIDRILPTVNELLANGAAVLLLSHFGRPKGKVVDNLSLAPVVPCLAERLGREVRFVATDWRDDRFSVDIAPGQVAVLENTRFHPGEEANDEAFARTLASLGDLYVNDAFSAAHRAHASTEAVAHLLPSAAGRAMQAELDALHAALETPQRPLFAVVGGAKVSTKLELLSALTGRVDALLIGGGMANTFLAATGKPVGRSLCEHDLADTAREVMSAAAERGCEILLPQDVVVAEELRRDAPHRTVPVDAVGKNDMILDIGPDAVADLCDRFAEARTVVWNGPLGAFETPPFDAGTNAVARRVGELTSDGRLRSIAGGGDTVAALANAGVEAQFSYVSTAGGAFLEWLEGKALPGVEALRA